MKSGDIENSTKTLLKISSKRAFTLVELIIIVAIIGILSSVIFNSVVNLGEGAENANSVNAVKARLQDELDQLDLSVSENNPKAASTAKVNLASRGGPIKYESPVNNEALEQKEENNPRTNSNIDRLIQPVIAEIETVRGNVDDIAGKIPGKDKAEIEAEFNEFRKNVNIGDKIKMGKLNGTLQAPDYMWTVINKVDNGRGMLVFLLSDFVPRWDKFNDSPINSDIIIRASYIYTTVLNNRSVSGSLVNRIFAPSDSDPERGLLYFLVDLDFTALKNYLSIFRQRTVSEGDYTSLMVNSTNINRLKKAYKNDYDRLFGIPTQEALSEYSQDTYSGKPGVGSSGTGKYLSSWLFYPKSGPGITTTLRTDVQSTTNPVNAQGYDITKKLGVRPYVILFIPRFGEKLVPNSDSDYTNVTVELETSSIDMGNGEVNLYTISEK